MKTASYYLKLIQRFKEQNAEKFGIKKIGIFGSVARGEQNENSDLDVFIDINDADYFRLCDIHDELEQICGCKVDLVNLHRFLRPLFMKNIERDAILA